MSTTTQTAPPQPTTSDTTPRPHAALDAADVEVFAGRVLDVISNGATALTLSIGHRTGLFDTMADLPRRVLRSPAPVASRSGTSGSGWPPCSSAASSSTTRPRATGHLPAEHAAVLTRRAGKDNLAKMAQLIGLLAGARARRRHLLPRRRWGPYSAYTEFHALMAEDSKDLAEAILVDAGPAARRRPHRPPGARDLGRRCRLRQRPSPQCAGGQLPGEQFRRLRLLRGGDHRGRAERGGERPDERPIRSLRTSPT